MTPADFDLWLADVQRRPLVMGVLNVTPDSFSDGGALPRVEAIRERGMSMVKLGAAVLDVGGESTRPGAQRVTVDEQIARVVPAIGVLRDLRTAISIDTTSSTVAAAAIDAGATMINDISAGRDDERMFALAAERGVPIALMHMQGTPRTMQIDPSYQDVVGDVFEFLRARAAAAMGVGVERHRVLLDVGIGFGKALTHNLTLLKHHARFEELGHAMLVGTSRKGFIGKLTGVTVPADRVYGSVATAAWAAMNGGHLFRVHDVEATRQTLAMIEAIHSA